MPATRLAVGVSRPPDEKIEHQAIRVNLPLRLGADFAQGGDEPLSVKVILKNPLTPIPAIHHMINRAGILNPQLPWHPSGLSLSPPPVKARTDPFTFHARH